jgi:hypothetical protein
MGGIVLLCCSTGRRSNGVALALWLQLYTNSCMRFDAAFCDV